MSVGPADLAGALLRVSPAQACQGVFLLLAAAILGMTVLPAATQATLLDYGARDQAKLTSSPSSPPSSPSGGTPEAKTTRPPAATTTAPATFVGKIERGIAAAAALVNRWQVPHAWFASFYALYLALALFWGLQWWAWAPQRQGTGLRNLFGWIVLRQAAAAGEAHGPGDRGRGELAVTGSLTQLYIAFGLEVLQAARRLYEHLYVFQSSGKSTMSAAQLALGWVFYICMSMAVWVEGAQTILQAKLNLPSTGGNELPTARLAIGVPLFLSCWLGQYLCHAHLAGLKKYTLPDSGLFRYIVCPHYTLEMLLYLALAIVGSPEGRLLNPTLLSSVAFIVVSLGVTANRTKKWYGDKFGAARVAGKFRMLPPVF